MERQLAAWHTSLMIACFAVTVLGVGVFSDHIGSRTTVMRTLGLVYVLCRLPFIRGRAMQLGVSRGLFALTIVPFCAKDGSSASISTSSSP